MNRVDLFKEYPETIVAQPDLYIKGIVNMLDGLYLTGDYVRFKKVLNELNEFKHSSNIVFTKNVELLLWHNYYTHVINRHFMEGAFAEGVLLAPEISSFIEINHTYIDNHNIILFYYKIASLYFGNGDHKNAIKYLNMVINNTDTALRSDIQCFARLLNLITHFEMKNYDLVEYLVKNTYRFLSKMQDLHQVQKEILFFLKKLPSISPDRLNDAFKNLLIRLKLLQEDPFEKRPFLYLDIISWLESKIEGVTVQKVIRKKHLVSHIAVR